MFYIKAVVSRCSTIDGYTSRTASRPKVRSMWLKQDARKVVEDIRTKDNLTANYVVKYFNLLAE